MTMPQPRGAAQEEPLRITLEGPPALVQRLLTSMAAAIAGESQPQEPPMKLPKRPTKQQSSSKDNRAFSGRLPFTMKERLLLIERFNRTCAYCKRQSATVAYGPDGRSWHIDHIYPVSKGGAHAPENWALSCATCNVKKHARVLTEARP